MPKSKDEKVFLKRFKQHQTKINHLLKSVNVNENRKVLLEFLAIMLDADPDALRPFMMDWIRAEFIDKRSVKWKDTDGAKPGDSSDQETKDTVSDMLAEFLKVKE